MLDRLKLKGLIDKVTGATDTNEALAVANIVKSLRQVTLIMKAIIEQEVDKAKQQIPVFEVPKSTVPANAAKLDQVKGIVLAAIGEVSLTLK